jgi:hypothetical protein
MTSQVTLNLRDQFIIAQALVVAREVLTRHPDVARRAPSEAAAMDDLVKLLFPKFYLALADDWEGLVAAALDKRPGYGPDPT